MPTLEFKGKQHVYAHHMLVPLHPLIPDAARSVGPADVDNNLIIHGDNLVVLKALLSRYAGRVKCIYIDPPYNTGNEGWVYNDRVNSPLMKAWLKQNGPVDGEDLERHDKWLCMMWPSLHLLKELLSDDGVIFVSIDDNEQHHLRMLMDEIFGASNFVSSITWQKKVSPSNDAKYFSYDHEYIAVYAKEKSAWQPNRLPMNERQRGYYKNPDDDPRGPWNSSTYTCNKTRWERPNLYYPITNAHTGKEILPKETAVWAYSKEAYAQHEEQGLIYWGASRDAKPRFKKFLKDAKRVVPRTVWQYDDVGHTQAATQELQTVIDGATFGTPKPSVLIRRILQVGSQTDSIVLDSFAGSGTTAHAVLAQNKEDGGSRKFILVECEDYADTITAERVRRVINGVPDAGDAALRKGLGGSFTYCTLGDPIEIEGMLTGDALPSYGSLAAYLLYTASGVSAGEGELRPQNDDGLFHETDKTDYYLLYQPDVDWLRSNDAVLNSERAERISERNRVAGKKAVVFGPAKYMGQRDLTDLGITFCQLPYELPVRA